MKATHKSTHSYWVTGHAPAPSPRTSLGSWRCGRLAVASVFAWLLACSWLASATGCLQNRTHGAASIEGSDCYSCHRADYENATEPPHVGAMPTTCGNCHFETSWRPARIAHPEARFSITAGAHAGTACSECHKASLGANAGGANTDCIGCHEKPSIVPMHTGRSGFVWSDSKHNFCLTCHPNGKAQGGGTHPENKFAIATGAHAGNQCADCHNPALGVNTAGANTDCIACHQRPDTDPTHGGRSGYAWSDSKHNFCLSCHPKGRAEGGTHPEAKFPITTGKHRNIVCADCHVAADGPNAQGANTNCLRCHPKLQTDVKHLGVSNYSYNTANKHFCLSCHPDGRE